MKSEKLYIILCLIIGVTLSGCIEEFEADIPAEDSNLLVVEGTICASGLNRFTLTRTQDINAHNYQTQMVAGAKVSVRGSDGSEYVAQQSYDGSGYMELGAFGSYSCWIDALNPDVEYSLHIEVDGEVYESEPQKPLRTEEIAEVTGVQNTPYSNIDILVTTEAPSSADEAKYYSWTYDETWEVHADNRTDIYFDTSKMDSVHFNDFTPNPFIERGWMDGTSSTTMFGSSSNYEGQRIQGLKMYEIGNSDERIRYRYSGLIHQRAISKAEYEYELARRQADAEMGGLFTPQPSFLPTNIRCLTSDKRAIGFVGCSLNTSEYRFFLNAADFTTYHPNRDGRVWLELQGHGDAAILKYLNDCCIMSWRGMFLCEWEANTEDVDGTMRSAWALINQLDVRYKGAYIEKPDFWKDE